MKTEQIIILVVAFFLGMLLLNMVKNVCRCGVVEGFRGTGSDKYQALPAWVKHCLISSNVGYKATNCITNFNELCSRNSLCNDLPTSGWGGEKDECRVPSNITNTAQLTQGIWNAVQTACNPGGGEDGGGSEDGEGGGDLVGGDNGEGSGEGGGGNGEGGGDGGGDLVGGDNDEGSGNGGGDLVGGDIGSGGGGSGGEDGSGGGGSGGEDGSGGGGGGGDDSGTDWLIGGVGPAFVNGVFVAIAKKSLPTETPATFPLSDSLGLSPAEVTDLKKKYEAGIKFGYIPHGTPGPPDASQCIPVSIHDYNDVLNYTNPQYQCQSKQGGCPIPTKPWPTQ
jgi:hypothetical protein